MLGAHLSDPCCLCFERFLEALVTIQRIPACSVVHDVLLLCKAAHQLLVLR